MVVVDEPCYVGGANPDQVDLLYLSACQLREINGF